MIWKNILLLYSRNISNIFQEIKLLKNQKVLEMTENIDLNKEEKNFRKNQKNSGSKVQYKIGPSSHIKKSEKNL